MRIRGTDIAAPSGEGKKNLLSLQPPHCTLKEKVDRINSEELRPSRVARVMTRTWPEASERVDVEEKGQWQQKTKTTQELKRRRGMKEQRKRGKRELQRAGQKLGSATAVVVLPLTEWHQ